MDPEEESFEKKLQESISNPKNMGDMENADAVGTVGNADCADMDRMFIKFDEANGKKHINKAQKKNYNK